MALAKRYSLAKANKNKTTIVSQLKLTAIDSQLIAN